MVMVMVVVGVDSPFSLLPGPMIWLYGVLHGDEKAEMCRLCIEQKISFLRCIGF